MGELSGEDAEWGAKWGWIVNGGTKWGWMVSGGTKWGGW